MAVSGLLFCFEFSRRYFFWVLANFSWRRLNTVYLFLIMLLMNIQFLRFFWKLELHLNNYFFSTCFIQISEYVEHNDAILLVVIPATQAPEISSSRALKIVKEFDAESGFFTVNLAFSNFFKKNSSFISSLLSFAHPFLMIFY